MKLPLWVAINHSNASHFNHLLRAVKFDKNLHLSSDDIDGEKISPQTLDTMTDLKCPLFE